LDRRLDGLQSRCVYNGGEEKNSQPGWESNPGRPARSLVATQIELKCIRKLDHLSNYIRINQYIIHARFQVFTAVKIQAEVFWVVPTLRDITTQKVST